MSQKNKSVAVQAVTIANCKLLFLCSSQPIEAKQDIQMCVFIRSFYSFEISFKVFSNQLKLTAVTAEEHLLAWANKVEMAPSVWKTLMCIVQETFVTTNFRVNAEECSHIRRASQSVAVEMFKITARVAVQ